VPPSLYRFSPSPAGRDSHEAEGHSPCGDAVSGPGFLSVKSWHTLQHYRDRNPPWIKLHNALLDDYAFLRLQDASKAQALCIMLLASRLQNRIPCDAEWIASRIGATSPVNLQVLVQQGFLEADEDASRTLALRLQFACLETETEREAETETPPPPARENPGWLTELPEAYRPYALSYLRAARSPDAVEAVIQAEAPGGIHQQRGVTWDAVGRALLAMEAKGERFGERTLRVFIGDLLKPQSGNGKGTREPQHARNESALLAWLEKSEAKDVK